jgi:hypothetical protein
VVKVPKIARLAHRSENSAMSQITYFDKTASLGGKFNRQGSKALAQKTVCDCFSFLAAFAGHRNSVKNPVNTPSPKKTRHLGHRGHEIPVLQKKFPKPDSTRIGLAGERGIARPFMGIFAVESKNMDFWGERTSQNQIIGYNGSC